MSKIKLTTKTMLECCVFISDGDHLSPPKANMGIPFITISNITNDNQISFDNTMFVGQSYYDNLSYTKKAKKGDILYSVVGSYGKPVYLNEDMPFIFQRHIAILRPNETINGKYLYYVMLNPYFFQKVDKLVIGCSQKTLTLDALRSIGIDIPSIEEQNKVEKLLTTIDKKIQFNNKINETLQQQASFLYDYWFTQFDFPDENGKPYKSSGGKMVWNEELKREIPDGWSVKSIAHDNEIYQPETISNSLFDDKYNFYVYGGGGLIGKYKQYNHLNSEVILSCRGNCGNVYYTMPKSWITGNAMVVRPNDDNLTKEYLYEFLKSYGVAKYVSGSVQKQLTRENLSLMPIIIPNNNILKEYRRIVKPIFLRMREITRENQELTSLRDWLLPMLMNGQATVANEEKMALQVNQNNIKHGYDQRFELWLRNQGLAARGDIDKATLREIFDAMDDDDK